MFARALRGLRLQLGTQLLSAATVALALLCMAGALLALENAGAWARRWGAPVRVTVFLAEGASGESVEQLRGVLASLPEVAEARYVSAAETREALARGGHDRALTEAPVELFPATIELRLPPTPSPPSASRASPRGCVACPPSPTWRPTADSPSASRASSGGRAPPWASSPSSCSCACSRW
jgi:hypothetical protein